MWGGVKIVEYRVNDFFSEEMANIVKDVANSDGVEIKKAIAFNYPMRNEKEIAFVNSFFVKAIETQSNLYYFPKPHSYLEIDDFALFSFCIDLTPDNFLIESLYRKNIIQRDFRGRLHKYIRKSLGAKEELINKKFFYESRMLFNISFSWEQLEVDSSQIEHDLMDNMGYFYKYPRKMTISTINFCNLKCVMCAMFSEDLQVNVKNDFFKYKQYLDEKSVYSMIDFLAKGSEEYLRLYGCSYIPNLLFVASGETLLDDRVPNFIKYARERNIFVTITTNGTLLDRKFKSLVDSGVNVIEISIDGATPETYKNIRGVDLARVENGVLKCIEYIRSNAFLNTEIHLNCVLVNEKVHNERELYLNKWNQYRDVIKKIMFSKCGWSDEKGQITYKDFDVSSKKDIGFICDNPWTQLQIDPYGDMSVCCTMASSSYIADKKIIGNAIEGIDSAWNSKKANQLRFENLKDKFKEFELCRNCSERFSKEFSSDGNAACKESACKDIDYK